MYAIFNDQSFNDMLTNDIVSFEQLSPVFSIFLQSFPQIIADASVTRMKDESKTVKRLSLKIDDRSFSFRPGQWYVCFLFVLFCHRV